MSAVVLVSHRTTGAQRDAVDAACREAELRCVHWRAGDSPVQAPALVVAGLRPGERQIPGDVVDLVDGSGDDTPVLLLSSDPLVRPSVTLQGGRLVVVAEPHAPERIYSHVRMLARAGARSALWWTADIAPPSFALSRVSEGSFTAIVPTAAEEAAQYRIGTLLDAACDLFARQTGPNVLGVDLERLVEDSAGIIHLAAAARVWTLYWPKQAGALYIHSAARLPPFYDLAAAASGGSPPLLFLRAQSGDVVLGASEAVLPARDLARSMANGAPAVAKHLAAQNNLFAFVAGVR